jgi:transglutaminase-like putative cysteine protease
MLIRLGYEIAIECAEATPVISLLEIHKDRQADIKRQPRVLTSPSVPTKLYHDLHGNGCRRFTAPAGTFRILYDAVIEDSGETDEVNTLAREVPVAELPDEVLFYLLGSRYCETDLLSDIAWQLFASVPAGGARVQAICDYVHRQIEFGYAHARSSRTAMEAHTERRGVCRDYAHLAIAFCRCMNIPARYCTGYLGDVGTDPPYGPMDFAAWFEAYLGNRWYTFDARNNKPRIGRVLMARGRDACDVALSNTFGPNKLESLKVWTDVVESA